MDDVNTRDRLATIPPELAASGLPRKGPSLAWRRQALYRALELAPDRSDRTLALWCAVSRELVRATRAKLVAEGVIRKEPDRIGGDGKRYRMEARP